MLYFFTFLNKFNIFCKYKKRKNAQAEDIYILQSSLHLHISFFKRFFTAEPTLQSAIDTVWLINNNNPSLLVTFESADL